MDETVREMLKDLQDRPAIKSKRFVQVQVQEKGVDDWRGFCSAIDSDGCRWELRGYGKTVGEAASDAYQAFQKEEADWNIHGYRVRDCIPVK